MNLMLAIAGGGAVGSVMRYLLGAAVQRALPAPFPLGTLLVNVVGCVAVGLAYVWLIERSGAGAELRAFVIVGILGGFTTFSAFSLETIVLLLQQSYGKAALNVFASVALCILGTCAGIAMARNM